MLNTRTSLKHKATVDTRGEAKLLITKVEKADAGKLSKPNTIFLIFMLKNNLFFKKYNQMVGWIKNILPKFQDSTNWNLS